MKAEEKIEYPTVTRKVELPAELDCSLVEYSHRNGMKPEEVMRIALACYID